MSLFAFDATAISRLTHRASASSFTRFLDRIQRLLEEGSASRRDLYMTTQNTHNKQTSIPPVRFEHTISAGERPQTYALDRVATGTGILMSVMTINHYQNP
jgi:hypothetical protein